MDRSRFASDVISVNGLDDRLATQGVIQHAQELMAGPHEKLLVARHAHKSVISPAVVPGEVITEDVVDYLRSGLAAAMQIPDPVDSELKSLRVVASG